MELHDITIEKANGMRAKASDHGKYGASLTIGEPFRFNREILAPSISFTLTGDDALATARRIAHSFNAIMSDRAVSTMAAGA